MKKFHWPSFYCSYPGWKRIFLIMRLTLLLLTIGLLQANATLYSQSAKLTLNIQDQSLRDVFREIENKSNFRFFYSDNLLLLDKVVKVNVKNTNVERILDDLLENSDYSYKILENNLIVIAPKSFVARQQQRITGTVTDAQTGDPIIGGNIVVEGTTIGTTTDVDGKFALDVPQANAVVVVSFVGYLSERVTITGQSNLAVKLTPDIKKLDEVVVVVGFGTQKKVNLTGSVATVDSKMLEMRPVSNVVQSLQGLVAGLNITQNPDGTQTGSANNINIRGVGTIGAGSSGNPLILIDGMEADIQALNPQDIDNISVLKDAAASSIYGSRAPFGVILITTKKGKAGKPVVSYSNSFRSSSPLSTPEIVDSYRFALAMNDMTQNAGNVAFFTPERI
jgi:TonB-dependent SusC/RagA subfamily outer membrane receptor